MRAKFFVISGNKQGIGSTYGTGILVIELNKTINFARLTDT